MAALAIMGVATGAFLALFWLTPLGVPPLRRLGGGELPPDLRFGYRADEVYRLMTIYGAAGLAHWRRMLLIDMFFPCAYGPFLAMLGARWADWAAAGPLWREAGVAFLILAVACDYGENALLLGIIKAFPRKRSAAIASASLFTRGKFLFLWIALAFPLIQGFAARLA